MDGSTCVNHRHIRSPRLFVWGIHVGRRQADVRDLITPHHCTYLLQPPWMHVRHLLVGSLSTTAFCNRHHGSIGLCGHNKKVTLGLLGAIRCFICQQAQTKACAAFPKWLDCVVPWWKTEKRCFHYDTCVVSVSLWLKELGFWRCTHRTKFAGSNFGPVLLFLFHHDETASLCGPICDQTSMGSVTEEIVGDLFLSNIFCCEDT